MKNIRKSVQNGSCSSLSNFLTACFISLLPLVACCSHCWFFFLIFYASHNRKNRPDDLVLRTRFRPQAPSLSPLGRSCHLSRALIFWPFQVQVDPRGDRGPALSRAWPILLWPLSLGGFACSHEDRRVDSGHAVCGVCSSSSPGLSVPCSCPSEADMALPRPLLQGHELAIRDLMFPSGAKGVAVSPVNLLVLPTETCLVLVELKISIQAHWLNARLSLMHGKFGATRLLSHHQK